MELLGVDNHEDSICRILSQMDYPDETNEQSIDPDLQRLALPALKARR